MHLPLLIISLKKKAELRLRLEVVTVQYVLTCIKWNSKGVKRYTRNNMGEYMKNKVRLDNEKKNWSLFG